MNIEVDKKYTVIVNRKKIIVTSITNNMVYGCKSFFAKSSLGIYYRVKISDICK